MFVNRLLLLGTPPLSISISLRIHCYRVERGRVMATRINVYYVGCYAQVRAGIYSSRVYYKRHRAAMAKVTDFTFVETAVRHAGVVTSLLKCGC